MKTFDLSPMFSDEEFKHWFLPQEGIIDAYVVVNNNKITGIIIVLTLTGHYTIYLRYLYVMYLSYTESLCTGF